MHLRQQRPIAHARDGIIARGRGAFDVKGVRDNFDLVVKQRRLHILYLVLANEDRKALVPHPLHRPPKILHQLKTAIFHIRQRRGIVDVLRLIDVTDSQSPLTWSFSLQFRLERGLRVDGFLSCPGRDKMN